MKTDDKRTELIIIGAGVVGSALAMALADLGMRDVLVVDPDLEGTLSSSELNAGGVRATFHQELNVICSQISIDYFAKHATDVGYRSVGYLWMQNRAGMDESLRSLGLWKRLGWPVEAWDVKQLQAHAPFIDKTDGLVGAIYGARDGLLNPNLLKLHFRERAKAKGVRFLDRLALRSSTVNESGVELKFETLPARLSKEEKEKYFPQDFANGGGLGALQVFKTARVVNCAGAWAKYVARMLGYECPSYSIRRQISLFDCRDFDFSSYGMMIDSSGVYFHPEASFIMGGIAERDTPRGANFHYEGESFFQEKIWMALAERSTKFEALRHLSGWGGLYEVSPDESAIIGEVTVGALKGSGKVFESHSYSGHGVMHSYACGVALAEKILNGKATLFDLDAFNGSRFNTGRLLSESAVI